jgi:uncharacterized protein
MNMYDDAIPPLMHSLTALAKILKKADAHVQSKKIDPGALLNFRLYPDMLPFIRQVLIACDFAKGCGARLAGIPVPSFEDTEKNFDDLQARIARTMDFINGLKKEQFAGAQTRTVTVKVAGQDMSMPGHTYLHSFVLPNFYFHMTTAYNILRHNGLELGKGDFMGRG